MNPSSPEAIEHAKAAPPTLTPKRSFQDHAHAAAEAAKAQDQAAAPTTAEDRMRQHMKLKEDEASGSREERRNKFKL